jgi:hypothetical protein
VDCSCGVLIAGFGATLLGQYVATLVAELETSS